jgi:hypothetical protein
VAAGSGARPGPGPPRPADRLAPLALVTIAAVVFAGATRYSFSQDDFTYLARAGGMLPRLEGPWRWLSQQLFWDAGRALAGLDARPYHLAVLAMHAGAAILLDRLLRHWCGGPAAFVGAAFFATHPALYTALYWIAANSDVMAGMLALAALLAALAAGRARWLAAPLFALSLMAKESTLPLPLVAALALVARGRSPRAALTAPPVLGMAAVAAAMLLVLTVGRGAGAAPEAAAHAPYALGFGAELWRNLLSYLGWTANFALPTVRDFSDRADPGVFGWGLAAALAWLAGLALPALRARGWLAAGLSLGLMLVPVLPLRNHTYHYYLYAALPFAGWLVAAALDVALAWRGARRAPLPEGLAWGVALPLAGLLTLNGALLVRKIETMPLAALPALRADTTVDRALVMERLAASVREARLPAGSRLVVWSPARFLGQAPPEAPELFWESNARTAAQDGLALRVLFPALDSARFARDPREVRAGDHVAVLRADGSAQVVSAAFLDSLLAAGPPAGTAGR